MDALATEVQFLEHLAPVWRALPVGVRGAFLVASPLAPRAIELGIQPQSIDADALRMTPQVGPVFGGTPSLVASIGDIKVGRRLGRGPFAFLEHGIGQSYGNSGGASYSGGPDRADNTLFLVPGPDPAQQWRRAYPKARVEEVGSPRLDFLPARRPGPGPVVAISWHWPAPLGIGGGLGSTLWNDPQYQSQVALLAERFTLIGHQHPNWLQRHHGRWAPSVTYAKLGIPFVESFDDVCQQADVYVCDNSSTSFEFAATGRPVVLMNSRGWAASRGKVSYGLRFWAAAHVGVNCDRPSDLTAAVERALEHRPEDIAAREDALELVYTYRYGAAERAAAVIVDWLREQGQVAA